MSRVRRLRTPALLILIALNLVHFKMKKKQEDEDGYEHVLTE
jgi:hypothetical protein